MHQVVLIAWTAGQWIVGLVGVDIVWGRYSIARGTAYAWLCCQLPWPFRTRTLIFKFKKQQGNTRKCGEASKHLPETHTAQQTAAIKCVLFCSWSPWPSISEGRQPFGNALVRGAIVIRTRDRPQKHVFPYDYTSWFWILCSPVMVHCGSDNSNQNPRWTQKTGILPTCLDTVFGLDYYDPAW